MNDPKFTISVHTVEKAKHEFANLSKEQVDRFKQIVWQQGCSVRVNETTFEQISPFRISQVFITQA